MTYLSPDDILHLSAGELIPDLKILGDRLRYDGLDRSEVEAMAEALITRLLAETDPLAHEELIYTLETAYESQ